VDSTRSSRRGGSSGSTVSAEGETARPCSSLKYLAADAGALRHSSRLRPGVRRRCRRVRREREVPKWAVACHFGAPLSVEQVTDPVIGTGEVLVDVVAAPVLNTLATPASCGGCSRIAAGAAPRSGRADRSGRAWHP
jgi:hypothetical protein